MKRLAYHQLLQWKHSSLRKPLILKGARQVGKTYLLEAFAKQEYEDYLYLNFDEKPEYANFFAEDLDPNRIIRDLELTFKKNIQTGKVLMVFDEIQECGNALNSLKYFCEKRNDIPIAAAGSLLGVKLTKGFPVGKVDFLELLPLSFFEFLDAMDEHPLVEHLQNLTLMEPVSLPLHENLIKLLKLYFFIGGMPEAISTYLKTQDLISVRKVQKAILDAYTLDFAKHAPKSELMKIMTVWNLIPSQLGKENKKFIFTAISKSARAQHYEEAIQWLMDAGLIYRIRNIKTPKLPLEIYAENNIFKIYLLDVGLLGAMANLAPEIMIHGHALFQEFKGSLTENFVAQELSLNHFKDIFYWTSSGSAEVDFIVTKHQKIYPLEAKSGTSTQMKSLKVYGEKYLNSSNHTDVLSRASLRNFIKDGRIINYPLYALALFPVSDTSA